MIGHTVMEIDKDEMKAAVEFYLNKNLLNTTFQKQHWSKVTDIRQLRTHRFIIEFDGPEPVDKVDDSSNDIS